MNRNTRGIYQVIADPPQSLMAIMLGSLFVMLIQIWGFNPIHQGRDFQSSLQGLTYAQQYATPLSSGNTAVLKEEVFFKGSVLVLGSLTWICLVAGGFQFLFTLWGYAGIWILRNLRFLLVLGFSFQVFSFLQGMSAFVRTGFDIIPGAWFGSQVFFISLYFSGAVFFWGHFLQNKLPHRLYQALILIPTILASMILPMVFYSGGFPMLGLVGRWSLLVLTINFGLLAFLALINKISVPWADYAKLLSQGITPKEGLKQFHPI